jgi:hypothetical protein
MEEVMTDEQIRSTAINAASRLLVARAGVGAFSQESLEVERMIRVAKKFEEYIRSGAV